MSTPDGTLTTSLSLTARCWRCGSKGRAPGDGTCMGCATAAVVAATAPARRGRVYGRRDVADMAASLADVDVLDDVVDELAVLALTARDLMAMGDAPRKERPMGEGERLAALRQTAVAVADVKERRLKRLDDRKAYVTADEFRLFLAELFAVLRRHIREESLFRDVAVAVAGIRTGVPARRPDGG